MRGFCGLELSARHKPRLHARIEAEPGAGHRVERADFSHDSNGIILTALLIRLTRRLGNDPLLLALLVTLPLLFWLAPLRLPELPGLVDWKTISALAELLLLSRGLEVSGLMVCLGRWLLAHIKSLRGLAVTMVIFAALLAAVVTNDVALFVTVPLSVDCH